MSGLARQDDPRTIVGRVYEDDFGKTGYLTQGHRSVTGADVTSAFESGSNLLYGELLPDGVSKALGAGYLAAASADTALELGMGTGKVALQAFLEYENLMQVTGIELARSRYQLGEVALVALVRVYPSLFELFELKEGDSVTILTCKEPKRRLTFRCGDMLETPLEELQAAQVVLFEVCLPRPIWEGVTRLLNQLGDGARILSLHDLRDLWCPASLVCPFHQREANKSTSDTFMSSWSENTGHHFFCYAKDTSLPQSVFPSVVSCAGDGSEDSSDAAEAAMLFPAGTPVEVMYSFWPTDGVFFNGDWYKGWIQGCHTSGKMPRAFIFLPYFSSHQPPARALLFFFAPIIAVLRSTPFVSHFNSLWGQPSVFYSHSSPLPVSASRPQSEC